MVECPGVKYIISITNTVNRIIGSHFTGCRSRSHASLERFLNDFHILNKVLKKVFNFTFVCHIKGLTLNLIGKNIAYEKKMQ